MNEVRMSRADIDEGKVARILQEFVSELERASAEYGPIKSRHEGLSIIREEFEEAWEEVKRNGPDASLGQELIQVGAMVLRMLLDIPNITINREGK